MQLLKRQRDDSLQVLNPKKARVLIVEDNRDDAVIVARALSKFGIGHVYCVETAEDALELLTRSHYDAALVDYRLPGRTGLDLLQEAERLRLKTKVILVTGVGDERIAAAAIKAGAVDYISKDKFLTSDIIRSLQSALQVEERERRDSLAAGGVSLITAIAEAAWLIEETPEGYLGSQPLERFGGDEGWRNVLAACRDYVSASLDKFPAVAGREEDEVIRMLLDHGASPREVTAVYREALRALDRESEGGIASTPFAPALSLARLLSRLVAAYQERLAIASAGAGTGGAAVASPGPGPG